MTAPAVRPFGVNAFGSNGAQGRSLGKPAAVYPGGIATDSNLIVAVDRQQARLAQPLGAADTSMTVADASLIVANCLLSIDAEIVKVTGPPAGNVVPVSRGFDGTTAALHLSGAAVSGFVDAWHHNALVAEIEAIENTLGPNLSKIPASPWLIASAFAFPPQTPGGNLAAGANVIALSPVPPGVNGSDTNHYLYISGGTGAAEAVPIIGGTAVGGAASGTVIVTCANTHSGAWTIQTATAGIQEALDSTANPQVLVLTGAFNIYATITVPTNGSVKGFSSSSDSASGATLLLYQKNTGIAIDLYGNQTTLRDLQIRQNVAFAAQTFTAAPGNIGVQCNNVMPRTANAATIENVQVAAFYQGFSFDSNNNLWLDNLNSIGSTQDNFVFAGCNGHARSLSALAAHGNGITCKLGTNGQGISPITELVEIYNSTGWGLNFQGGGQWSNVTSQQNGLGDYYFKATGLSTFSTITSDSAGTSVNGWTFAATGSPTGVGMFFDVGAPINISGVSVVNANGNAIRITGNGNVLTSAAILTPNKAGNTDDNKYGVLISGGGYNTFNGLLGDQNTAVKIGGANAYLNAIYDMNLNNASLAFPVIELFNGANYTNLSGVVAPNAGVAVKTDTGSSLVYNPGLYTYAAPNSLAPNTLLSPTALAPISNGGTVAVTANAITIVGQITHVGAGLIKTINLTNGATNATGFLIADGAFTTDQTGNINSAALTAVPGTLYIWVLDAAPGKFYIR